MIILLLFNLDGVSGVVHVTPNSFYTQHTTRSWDYLGLSSHSPTNLMHETNMGDRVIVGIIDSEIWPECDSGRNFNATTACNRKLIGAKWFKYGFLHKHPKFRGLGSPRDKAGHGTHTATTAAGYFVANANYQRLADA
ncbi:hypothetical protein FF1_015020 [Malus domestica]